MGPGELQTNNKILCRKSQFFFRIYAQRHCEPPQEAWQSSLSGGGISGLLRCARNDEGSA
jgi:hypothetical protein